MGVLQLKIDRELLEQSRGRDDSFTFEFKRYVGKLIKHIKVYNIAASHVIRRWKLTDGKAWLDWRYGRSRREELTEGEK